MTFGKGRRTDEEADEDESKLCGYQKGPAPESAAEVEGTRPGPSLWGVVTSTAPVTFVATVVCRLNHLCVVLVGYTDAVVRLLRRFLATH